MEDYKLKQAMRLVFEKLRDYYNKHEHIPNGSWVRHKESGIIKYVTKQVDKKIFEDKNGVQYLYADFELLDTSDWAK